MPPRSGSRACGPSRSWWAAVGLALALAVTARADDDRPAFQRMQFVERGGNLTVTADITRLFDSAAFQALDSGFVSTVVIQTWVYRQGSRSPVAFTRTVRSVVYDMWDEDYVIKLCKKCRPVKVRSPAAALKLVTTLQDMPIATLADIPYRKIFFLAIRADLNPVDKATLAEVRRWLSESTGGGLDRGSSFWGNFVSVFVNPKIAEADRVFRVRSQPFYRPRPAR